MKNINRWVYPLVTLLSLGAAFAAHAESPTQATAAERATVSTKTRSQVQAELFQARADGSIKAYSNTYNPLTVARSLATREEVQARLRVERSLNPAERMLGEDSGSFYLAQVPQPRDASRALARASR